MSLTIDFNYIFTQLYPTHSIEDMQDLLKELHNDMNYLKLRMGSSSCTCDLQHHPVSTSVSKRGKFKVSFTIPHEELCGRCQKTLEPFPNHLKGAGISFIDHWNPRLLLLCAEHQQELLNKAIFCKQEEYENLNNEEIEKHVKETYDYSRYLRRTENDFASGAPSGLLDAIEKTEKEMEALEFEIQSRVLCGKMELNVTSSV